MKVCSIVILLMALILRAAVTTPIGLILPREYTTSAVASCFVSASTITTASIGSGVFLPADASASPTHAPYDFLPTVTETTLRSVSYGTNNKPSKFEPADPYASAPPLSGADSASRENAGQPMSPEELFQWIRARRLYFYIALAIIGVSIFLIGLLLLKKRILKVARWSIDISSLGAFLMAQTTSRVVWGLILGIWWIAESNPRKLFGVLMLTSGLVAWVSSEDWIAASSLLPGLIWTRLITDHQSVTRQVLFLSLSAISVTGCCVASFYLSRSEDEITKSIPLTAVGNFFFWGNLICPSLTRVPFDNEERGRDFPIPLINQGPEKFAMIRKRMGSTFNRTTGDHDEV